MANLRMAAQRLLDKYELEAPDDFVREMLELVLNLVMNAEVTAQIGAERYERSEDRTNRRNGSRSRRWDTRVGTLALEIPKLREGSYFPSFIDPRLRSERAMLAVIQEAYIDGVSTRKVDRLVKAMGVEGISKSQVSRICVELDEMVEAWRNRRLEDPIVYMWLDATFPKVRENGRVSSMGAVLAVGVTADGRRRILGLDIGATENGDFWLSFRSRPVKWCNFASWSATTFGGCGLVDGRAPRARPQGPQPYGCEVMVAGVGIRIGEVNNGAIDISLM